LRATLPQRTVAQLPGLGAAVDRYQRSVAALERVLALRELPVDETGAGAVLPEAVRDIRLDRVWSAYPGRAPVLRDLSMVIPAGRTTAIVGTSGAGKTTIAKLLLRFHEPVAGRLLLGDSDLRGLRLADLRRSIGFVSQDAVLFDDTVAENIRYGSFDATDEQVAVAAHLAGAAAFVVAMPESYRTVVGERGVTLSGGQRQRIALARVILRDPPVAILDEATSGVDNETEAAIQRALRDFSRHRTVVVIAHRLSTVRHADLIYVLGDGGVLEAGTHTRLLERDGAYAALWRLQIGE
jgi:ATP-binding cassette subfamily B protein